MIVLPQALDKITQLKVHGCRSGKRDREGGERERETNTLAARVFEREHKYSIIMSPADFCFKLTSNKALFLFM